MRKLVLLILLNLNISVLVAQNMEWMCHPGKYSDIEYMGYDIFKVENSAGKCGLISADGRNILDVRYERITPFVEERALILDKSGHRILGILNQHGEILKSFEKEQIFTTAYPYYKEGLLGYKEKSGLCGYINNQGIISINPRFSLAAPFQNGIATVQYADGYYGMINKSGGSAIISDTKYRFLSSMVEGLLWAVTSSSRGGDILRIMKLEGNQLKSIKTLESRMYVDISDDFTYLVSQNGHHYYIDDQWRISGANYKLSLPYEIIDNPTFVTECAELLSKHESKNGIQITYMGKPILEHSFADVETYEKKYAIVRAKDKSIGVLKLNPSAGIEIIEPTEVFIFNHNPLPVDLSANLDEFKPEQYVEVVVDIKDVNPLQVKCYINEDGYLRYAPLKRHNGVWKLNLPYFHPDTKFDNIVTKKVDIAITYDGLDWMHRLINLSTKHEPGYDIQIVGSPVTDSKGAGLINIIVESVKGVPNKSTRIDITGCKSIYLKGEREIISIPVNDIPEGKSQTFTYTVTVTEEGCPIIKKTVSKVVTRPQQETKKNGTDNNADKKEKKEIIII